LTVNLNIVISINNFILTYSKVPIKVVNLDIFLFLINFQEFISFIKIALISYHIQINLFSIYYFQLTNLKPIL